MTVTYWALLDGDAAALALLASCFTEPTCQVLRTVGADDTQVWTLRSSDFVYAPRLVCRPVGTDAGTTESVVNQPHGLGEAMDAFAAWTAARLQALNGAARLADPHYTPVRAYKLISKRAGSGVRVCSDLGFSMEFRARDPIPASRPKPPPSPDRVRQWADLALIDETVAIVLAVLTARPTWTALGLVLDAIGHDPAGRHRGRDWLGKAVYSRLKGSINYARSLGEGPRHLGRVDEGWDAASALPLSQAHNIVWELVHTWIGSKLDPFVERGPR